MIARTIPGQGHERLASRGTIVVQDAWIADERREGRIARATARSNRFRSRRIRIHTASPCQPGPA
jgi:hypothetical protein